MAHIPAIQYGKRGAQTFIIDFPGIFFCGVLFSLLANKLEVYIPFYRRSAFYHGLFFCGGIYAIALASYMIEPDWMCMYYFHGEISWMGFLYIGLIMYLSPFVLGFGLGFEVRKNSFLTILILLFSSLLVQGLVIAFFWERYWYVGTHVQYLQGTGIPLSAHEGLFWVSSIGASVLLVYFIVLARYYWKQRWRNYMSPSFVVHTLYPSQIKVVQALGLHLFSPVYTDTLLEEERLGKKFSEYLSSSPWINQVVVSLVVEIIQILPIFILKKPRFFTALSPEDKELFLDKIETTKIASLHHMILILKTMLSLLYYEEERVFHRVSMAPPNTTTKGSDASPSPES